MARGCGIRLAPSSMYPRLILSLPLIVGAVIIADLLSASPSKHPRRNPPPLLLAYAENKRTARASPLVAERSERYWRPAAATTPQLPQTPALALPSLFRATNESTQPCRVLALSAGGSYGAWEAGVLAKLLEIDPLLDYDFITGSSAGALNAVYMSAHIKGPIGIRIASAVLREYWINSKSWNVFAPNLGLVTHLHRQGDSVPRGLLTTQPMRGLLQRLMKGREGMAGTRPVSVGAVDLSSGMLQIFREEVVRQHWLDVVMASTAIPVVFPPVEFNGTLYVDGGTVSSTLLFEGVNRCGNQRDIKVDVFECSAAPKRVDVLSSNYSFLDLILRDLQVYAGNNHYEVNDNKCAFSRTHVSVYRPIDRNISSLDFNHGSSLWKSGKSSGSTPDETFYLCD